MTLRDAAAIGIGSFIALGLGAGMIFFRHFSLVTWVPLGVVVACLGFYATHGWRKAARWRLALRRLGFTRARGGEWHGRTPAGAEVAAFFGTPRGFVRCLVLRPLRDDLLPRELRVWPQDLLATLVDWSPTLTGDVGFDAVVYVDAPTDQYTARLTRTTRERLAYVVARQGVVIADGCYYAPSRHTERSLAMRVIGAQLDRHLRALAELLVEPAQVPSLVLRNGLADPHPVFAAGCLRALREYHRSAPETRRLAAALLGHPSPEHRLAAARLLDEQAVLAALVADPLAEDRTRAAALESWVLRSVGEAASGVLEALATGLPFIGAGAVQACIAAGVTPSVDRLPTPLDWSAAVALAELLGQYPPEPRVEDRLVGLLSHDHRAVQLAALVALEAVGTARAGAAIRATARFPSPNPPEARPWIPELRQRARAALASIARRGDAGSGGELSVADEPALGQLAVIDEAGAVSLAEERHG